jgi:hypothetical protein
VPSTPTNSSSSDKFAKNSTIRIPRTNHNRKEGLLFGGYHRLSVRLQTKEATDRIRAGAGTGRRMSRGTLGRFNLLPLAALALEREQNRERDLAQRWD